MFKCKKCGGNIERVAYNSDWNLLELWDCMCENCGHMILGFPGECKCGGMLEFYSFNEFVESGVDGKACVVLSCSRCLKGYLSVGDQGDIDELEECIKWYEENKIEDMEGQYEN